MEERKVWVSNEFHVKEFRPFEPFQSQWSFEDNFAAWLQIVLDERKVLVLDENFIIFF
jgi:hypothetical protein